LCVAGLDPDRVEDAGLRQRLLVLQDAEKPPAGTPLPEAAFGTDAGEFWQPGESGSIAELEDAARIPLAELQSLVDSSPDDGVTAASRLGDAFERAEAATRGGTTAPARLVLARAADQLAGDPALRPDTDLGRAVLRVGLEATARADAGQ